MRYVNTERLKNLPKIMQFVSSGTGRITLRQSSILAPENSSTEFSLGVLLLLEYINSTGHVLSPSEAVCFHMSFLVQDWSLPGGRNFWGNLRVLKLPSG